MTYTEQPATTNIVYNKFDNTTPEPQERAHKLLQIVENLRNDLAVSALRGYMALQQEGVGPDEISSLLAKAIADVVDSIDDKLKFDERTLQNIISTAVVD